MKTWMLAIFKKWFSPIRFTKTTQILLSSPCGTVIESCSEHFMHFRCSFPRFKTKFTANVMFLHVSY
jgi:hypothetical protein